MLSLLLASAVAAAQPQATINDLSPEKVAKMGTHFVYITDPNDESHLDTIAEACAKNADSSDPQFLSKLLSDTAPEFRYVVIGLCRVWTYGRLNGLDKAQEIIRRGR